MDENEAILELKEVAKMMELERIKVDLKYYGCEFDSWISEQWIVDTGKVEAAVKKMDEMGLLYEQDGAIYMKTTKSKGKRKICQDGFVYTIFKFSPPYNPPLYTN